MKRGTYLFVSLLLAGGLHGGSAQSQEVKAGDLVISQPWSRAAPKGAETTPSYLTIQNKGATADRLVGASTDIAEKVQIEQIVRSGGGTQLNPVEGGLAIPPGEKLVLAPGSNRLGLMKLKSALKKGTRTSIALQFEKAGKVDVSFEVLSPASTGPAAPKADDGKMKK